MPCALDIAGKKIMPAPAESAERKRPTLNYSIYAAEILRFLAFHRICFASQLCQALPHCFSTDRDARRHLETLEYVGEVDSVKYTKANHANVYIITDKGFAKARELCNLNPDSIPSRYVAPRNSSSRSLRAWLMSRSRVRSPRRYFSAAALRPIKVSSSSVMNNWEKWPEGTPASRQMSIRADSAQLGADSSFHGKPSRRLPGETNRLVESDDSFLLGC